jgi:hypothetical protein
MTLLLFFLMAFAIWLHKESKVSHAIKCLTMERREITHEEISLYFEQMDQELFGLRNSELTDGLEDCHNWKEEGF